MTPQPYERVTDAVAARAGVRPLTPAEAGALLALARRVAHSSDDRRSAPLVCYLAGQALAGEADEATRLARINALAEGFADAD